MTSCLTMLCPATKYHSQTHFRIKPTLEEDETPLSQEPWSSNPALFTYLFKVSRIFLIISVGQQNIYY